MTTIAVLAGNRDQYNAYVQPYLDKAVTATRRGSVWMIDDVEYLDMNQRHQACGHLIDAYVIVGTFSDRPDAGDIMAAVLPCLRRK